MAPRSHLIPVLSLLSFALAGASALGQAPVRDRYTFSHGGRSRLFEVATDEIEVRDAQRQARKVRVARATRAEDARQAALRQTQATGEEADLVLYETGQPHTETTRRIVTKGLAVKLRPGTDPAVLAAKLGLVSRGENSAAPGWFMFEARDSAGTLAAMDALALDAGVEAAEPQLARRMTKRFTPNDTLFSKQWHLKNTGQSGITPGIDVNVTTVWDTYRGTGIRLAIVDDGLQISHPDLSPNYDSADSHDWNDATPNDPSPNVAADFHGTSCAGVAGARGNNALGVSGAAPEVSLVGLRLIAANETDQEDADAMNWKSNLIQVKSNSWGPGDTSHTLEAPGTLMAAALATATTSGRGGLGTIFLWAGGNGGDVGDNSNYDGYANSRFTIAVGAVDSSGHRSYYSEPGANLIISAPSNGDVLGITTVDLTGSNGYNPDTQNPTNYADTNYTDDFGGTSSACPLAAGVVALLLQSKPTLGWRDVQEILIHSATKVDATDPDWITNAAGFHFNHQYGAGLINAQAAVTLASTWTNLPTQQNTAVTATGLPLSIPNNNATGVSKTFVVSGSPLRMERVTVKVNITHANRDELVISLTSPSGVVSRLAEEHVDPNGVIKDVDYANWTFSTVRNWGELSPGTWTLKIADVSTNTTTAGSLTSAVLTIYGTPGNYPPVVTAATVSPAGPVFFDQSLTVGGVTATDTEGNAITLGYQWEQSPDGTTYTAISGATTTTLALTSTQSGNYVRCAVRGTDATSTGLPFYSNAVAVNRRPVELARSGQPYSYDSDLVGGSAVSVSRSILINEFSQGPSGTTSEWVELLTLRNADLRGLSFWDASGRYGIFSTSTIWSAVPAGTLIVLHNSGTADPLVPPDDLDPSDHLMVVPINNATLISNPSWPGFSNTGAESLQIRDTNGTTVIDGISFNSTSGTQTPWIGTVGSTTAAAYTSNTDAGAETAANWSTSNAGSATPGAANGASNASFITALRSGSTFRLGAASDLVPGLTIDPATGILGGTPSVPGGGFYQIVIERVGSTVISQTFPLLVADANGNYQVPTGKTWTLDQPTTLAGNLTIVGTVNTAGFALTVNGTIAVDPAATVTNATGAISYLQRSGSALPGATALLLNAANDLADLDGDGTVSLLEFELGMDPSADSRLGLPQISNVAGHLTLSYATPVGITGVTAAVEVSGNLTQWSTGPGFTEVMSDTTANGVHTLVIRDVATAAPRYIRLKVTR